MYLNILNNSYGKKQSNFWGKRMADLLINLKFQWSDHFILQIGLFYTLIVNVLFRNLVFWNIFKKNGDDAE